MSKGIYSSYSPFKNFVTKFLKQRLAVIASIIVTIIVFIGLFGNWLAPYDPYRPVTMQYEERGIDSDQLTSERVSFQGILSDGTVVDSDKFETLQVESENRRVASVRRVGDGVIVSANTGGATNAILESENVSSIIQVNVSGEDVNEGEVEIIRLEAEQPNEILESGDRYEIQLTAILSNGEEIKGIEAVRSFLDESLSDEEQVSTSSGFVSGGQDTKSTGGLSIESLTSDIASVTNEGVVTVRGEGDGLVKVSAENASTVVHLPTNVSEVNPVLVSIVPTVAAVSLVDIYKHQPPSQLHYFGTDHQNRDIFSRVIIGTKETLLIGFVSVAIGAFVGTALGLTAGYYGGKFDSFITRFTDILLAFPGILLAIAVIAFLGAGLVNIIFAVAIFTVPIFIRIVRGSTLALKEMTYVEAAKSIGVKDPIIILRHIFPGTLSVVMVFLTMRVGVAILIGAALSFLGLGGDITAPEWGSMLSAAKDNSGNLFHPTFFPGLAIVITVLSFNILGDGLRDALDPKLKE